MVVVVGVIGEENSNGRHLCRPLLLKLKVSRAGLEPATLWLKAKCSTN